jgi:hypothetical protein
MCLLVTAAALNTVSGAVAVLAAICCNPISFDVDVGNSLGTARCEVLLSGASCCWSAAGYACWLQQRL